MITIIDLHIGNIGSVTRALKFLKCPFVVTDEREKIESAKKLLLPGVGSFREASRKLIESQLKDSIRLKVLNEHTPIMGICLGMQLLAETGYEGGQSQGLGLIKAEVKEIRAKEFGLNLPHMGWNDLSSYDLRLLKGVKPSSCFYFVHSYEMILHESIPHVTTNYGTDVLAMVEKDNIFAAQFHPEKSQEAGLAIIKNFIEI
jgi:glutamine amidotransferase